MCFLTSADGCAVCDHVQQVGPQSVRRLDVDSSIYNHLRRLVDIISEPKLMLSANSDSHFVGKCMM